MSIYVSKTHGINPSISKCFWCLEDNAVVLFGRLTGDEKAPMHCGVIDMTPCNQCKSYMQQGVILISVKDESEDTIESERKQALREYEDRVRREGQYWKHKHPFQFIPNPYRTEGWIVVTDEYILRALNPKTAQHVLSCRWSFVPDQAWDALGLPREQIAEDQ